MIAKKDVVKYFFAIIAVVNIFYFWSTINSIVQTDKSESWLRPIAIFSVVFIAWSFVAILEDIWWRLVFFAVLLGAEGIFFTQNIHFIGGVVLGIGFLCLGSRMVKLEMINRIKINISSSLRLGRRFFVMAITIIIVAGFLVPTLLSGKEKSLPLINIGEGQAKLVGKMVSMVDSNMDSNEVLEMTVDEYILKQEGVPAEIETSSHFSEEDSILGNFSTMDQEATLEAGRESVAKLVDHTISGNEKISSIFVEVINNRINSYFKTDSGEAGALAPWLFAGVSFFAIFSVGSFFTMVLVFVVEIIFKLLLMTKLLKIYTEEVSVEIID